MGRWRTLTSGIVLAVILAGVYFSVSSLPAEVANRISAVELASPEPQTPIASANPLVPRPSAASAQPAASLEPAIAPSRTVAPSVSAAAPTTAVATLPITTTQLAGCGASAGGPCAYNGLLRSGRLAFLDADCGLNIIDAGSGRHWQSNLAVQPARLTDGDCEIRGWSDQPGELSVWVRLPDDAGTSLVFGLDGQSIKERPFVRPTSAPPADDARTLLTTAAEDGRTAWFDRRGIAWRLRVAAPSGQGTLDLPFASDDRIHQIVTWVPTTDLLLIESSYASSGAMLYGGLLSTVDVTTGLTRELGLRTRWGDGEKSWNPLHPTIVDLIVTGTDREQSSAQWLVELDLGTGQIEYLTETSARTPLWSPDGTLLAYAMNLSDEPRSLSDGGDNARSVIVVQDRFGSGASGKPKVVVPGDAVLGWTADGAVLIYGRYTDADRRGLELRAVTVDGVSDELIAANVHAPPCWPECFWPWVVTYQP